MRFLRVLNNNVVLVAQITECNELSSDRSNGMLICFLE